MGVLLHSSSNGGGPGQVWMVLLGQHSPSSPVFHNLRHFIDAISPTTGLPLEGNPVTTADANQNCVTIIRHSFLFLARSLASLISHPPIIPGSLYSIHPPKPRPPSSTSPINFRIHYLFQQSFIIHPLHVTKPSQNIHIYSSCQFSPHTCYRSHYFIPMNCKRFILIGRANTRPLTLSASTPIAPEKPLSFLDFQRAEFSARKLFLSCHSSVICNRIDFNNVGFLRRKSEF